MLYIKKGCFDNQVVKKEKPQTDALKKSDWTDLEMQDYEDEMNTFIDSTVGSSSPFWSSIGNIGIWWTRFWG